MNTQNERQQGGSSSDANSREGLSDNEARQSIEVARENQGDAKRNSGSSAALGKGHDSPTYDPEMKNLEHSIENSSSRAPKDNSQDADGSTSESKR